MPISSTTNTPLRKALRVMTSTDPNTQAFYGVACLASCAVREVAPDPERVSQMDLGLVYREASR